MANPVPKKICVIGAGAAGLCAARFLAGDLNFSFCVYEQTNIVGGTWVYREETGVDEHGLKIHSSMYRDLRTNLPVRIMNFPDYVTMTTEEPSCLGHREILAYLQNYAEHFDLYKHIKFSTKVENVRFQVLDNSREIWVVKIRNLKTKIQEELNFDAVMICNGHYFDPYVPSIPGIESFPGIILHSHIYRKPETFAGRIIFILGASASGIDIAIELADHASKVYLSHNNERIVSELPSNLEQLVGVKRIEGHTFFLKDQSNVVADVFILCTGYRYSFPFLDESCKIQVDNNYITPLYKHLINIEHPSMCIVGVPSIVIPFPMFHMQVQFFLAVLKNTTILPDKSVMLDDSKLKTTKKRHAHKLMDKQWEYNNSLAIAAGFNRLPSFYKSGYDAWSKQRKAHLLNYKDAKFVIHDDREIVELVIPNLNMQTK